MNTLGHGSMVLGLSGVLLITACSGGSDPADAAMLGARAAADRPVRAVAAAGSTVDDARASAPVAAADARPALVVVGEIELPGGRVERAYRVRLARPGVELFAATTELVGVPPGVEIVRGRLDVGDLPAGTAVMPAQAVTLRHASDLALQPADLQWRWYEGGSAMATAGRLLAGEPQARATGAIAAWSVDRAGGGDRLAAVLHDAATVGAVNAALRQAAVGIVTMRPGNHTLTLRPQGGDDRAWRQATETLLASGAFVRVDRLRMQPTHAVGGVPWPGWSAVPDAQAVANDAAAEAACDS